MESDEITGSNAGEVLAGGPGQDRMSGGRGSDVFLFEAPNEFGKQSLDIITDFDPQEGDKVAVSGDVFGGVTKVKLDVASSKKEVKKSARTKNNFIYDERKGFLYFNENGRRKGFGDGGEFARLLGTPEIDRSDFEIL